MMNSRSIASTSKLLAVVVAVCAVLGAGRIAEAGRKRVVVLEFEGPKGDKLHADLVKLIKKTHTVVPTAKWNGAADQLGAGALTEKNIKKVARKLKIDAVVEGTVEKRREEYILRLRLRAGKSGEAIGDTISTKTPTAKLDGRAQRDLRDELVGAIDNVESNRLSGPEDEAEEPATVARSTEDEAERPAKKAKKASETSEASEEGDDARPARKGFARRGDDERGADRTERRGKTAETEAEAEADDKPAKKIAAKKPADEDDAAADKKPARKLAGSDSVLASRRPAAADDDDTEGGDKARKPKRVAAREDADAEASADRAEVRLSEGRALSPGERALDAVVGLSLTSRTMSFTVATDATAKPPGYSGTPVAGVMLDVTAYPMAFGHDRPGQLKNLGIQVVFDRVITLNSKDPATGMVYSTTEQRYWLTALFRHAFGSSETAPVVIGSLGYGGQTFDVQSPAALALPDVTYAIVAPGAGLRYPVSPKFLLALDAKVLFPLSTGEIQNADRYGAASVFGFEGAAGADYLITPRIFARASGRFETFGFNFKGVGTQKATGARDSYFGGALTVGYLY